MSRYFLERTPFLWRQAGQRLLLIPAKEGMKASALHLTRHNPRIGEMPIGRWSLKSWKQ